MKVILRAVRAATHTGAAIAGIALSTVALLLVANVILRFFGIQILGLYEILTALTVVGLGLSLGDSQREKQHVAIDLLTTKLPPRVQQALSAIITLLSLAIFAVLVVALTRYASFQMRASTASELLGIPTWPTLTALIVGIVLLMIVLLVDAVRHASAAVTGADPEPVW